VLWEGYEDMFPLVPIMCPRCVALDEIGEQTELEGLLAEEEEPSLDESLEVLLNRRGFHGVLPTVQELNERQLSIRFWQSLADDTPIDEIDLIESIDRQDWVPFDYSRI